MNSGYIYVLSNPIFEKGVFKIGMTQRTPEERLTEIGAATGVPQAFKLEYTEYVHQSILVEKKVHEALALFRINNKREFFRVQLKEAIGCIQAMAAEYRPNVGKNEAETTQGNTDVECSTPLGSLGVEYDPGYGQCHHTICEERAARRVDGQYELCTTHMYLMRAEYRKQASKAGGIEAFIGGWLKREQASYDDSLPGWQKGEGDWNERVKEYFNSPDYKWPKRE